MEDNEKYVKSGLYFIAYIGKEFNYKDINDALDEECPDDYTVHYRTNNDLIFAKKKS